MMFRGVQLISIFVAINYCMCGDIDAIKIHVDKRHVDTNNYQMCFESFAIHKDKIIKTQDSRNMGAKYLNEMEVDSQLDCLKYCCETEGCDVFIFEEKVRICGCYV